ncbi:MAG: 2-phospho-L-lactate guanylyltransferase [Motiliproteus sp.]
MKTIIVIPMKDPRQSKQRLSGVLNPANRQQLALSMFTHSLEFFQTHFPAYTVLVVTRSERIRAIAKRHQAEVLMETPPGGLNGAASQAAQWSRQQGYESQLLIPADIAVLDEHEIGQLLDQLWDAPWVSICPADDGGTNALMTSPPDVIPFRFGIDSCEEHLAVARKLGVHSVVNEMKNLAFDVDSPDDLEQLAALPMLVPAQEVLNACNMY